MVWKLSQRPHRRLLLRREFNTIARNVWPATKTAAARQDRETRAQAADNCSSCHMPKSPTVDVGHTVFTDHSIPRRLRPQKQNSRLAGTSLQAFRHFCRHFKRSGPCLCGSRYGAEESAFAERSFESLKASRERFQVTPQLCSNSRFSMMGRTTGTRPRNSTGKLSQPTRQQIVALLNLGALLAQQQQFQEAISLWQDALKRNPGLETASVYLALARLRTGNAFLAREDLLQGSRVQSRFENDSRDAG